MYESLRKSSNKLINWSKTCELRKDRDRSSRHVSVSCNSMFCNLCPNYRKLSSCLIKPLNLFKTCTSRLMRNQIPLVMYKRSVNYNHRRSCLIEGFGSD